MPYISIVLIDNIAFSKTGCGMDTWDIPYQRKALPMPGSSVTAPLDQCRDNFDTEDASECVSVEHDTASGAVNVTLHCCVYNDKMFKRDTMIRANAYRCEILVCEEKVAENLNLLKRLKKNIREMELGLRLCQSTPCSQRESRCRDAV